MAKIRQADIYPGSISFTKDSNFAITSTVIYAQSNLTKTAFAIGTVGGMATTDPIAVKEFGSGITGWSDEQDWSSYNNSFTTTIPVTTVSGGVVTPTTSTNASISIGDLVGIYGPGTWSAGGTLSSAKASSVGAGSQNAALIAGGDLTNVTELFNGSIWSTSGALSIAKREAASAGSQNAGLIAGGYTGSRTNATELFNGSTWSTSGSLSIAKLGLAGAGSQNAGLIAGGTTGSATNATELFNGSTWSTSGSLSIAKSAGAGAGSQNAALIAGGTTGSQTNATELFNGSTWAIGGILSEAKSLAAGAGSQNAGLIAGGYTGGADTNTSELFNGSTWSASGVLSSVKESHAGAGSQNAGLIAGGYTGGYSNATEIHLQTLYRKITTLDNFKSAKNVGIAFDVSSVTISVKFQGYIDNINVTSSNSAVTTAAQWVNKWAVLSRFSTNTSNTSSPSSILIKSAIDADDYLVGLAISRTQMQVFSGNIFPYDRIGRW